MLSTIKDYGVICNQNNLTYPITYNTTWKLSQCWNVSQETIWEVYYIEKGELIKEGGINNEHS